MGDHANNIAEDVIFWVQVTQPRPTTIIWLHKRMGKKVGCLLLPVFRFPTIILLKTAWGIQLNSRCNLRQDCFCFFKLIVLP